MPFADPGAKRAYDAARYVANREVVKARVAAYRLANSDEILRRQDEYRCAHKELTKERNAKYYQRNRAKKDAQTKAWAENNPEARRIHRRVSKRRHPGTQKASS